MTHFKYFLDDIEKMKDGNFEAAEVCFCMIRAKVSFFEKLYLRIVHLVNRHSLAASTSLITCLVPSRCYDTTI